jgi:predicted dehydrogenase
LVVRPATPGGIHITDWAVSVARPDGSAADLPVPARFSPIPEAVPAGPPRNVAVLYREFARAIGDGQPAAPDFRTAVRYHQLLEQIQRASDTGIRQDTAG